MSQSFVLSTHESALVAPQVLESHDLTPGFPGINFFYFLSNVLLHCVFDFNVLAIRGGIVARYGFAKALSGVCPTVARELQTKRVMRQFGAKEGTEELTKVTHHLVPAMNQQGMKEHGVTRLHGEVSVRGS